jgi:DNA gyrase subunit A
LIADPLKDSGFYLLTATEKGFAKKTAVKEYRCQTRGGKGIINIKLSAKLGSVSGLSLVGDDDELMCITHKGILIRFNAKSVRASARSTQGVKIINLDSGDRLSTVARISLEQ